MPAIRLKPGRERALLRRHPWIFSGAIDALAGDPEPGETVDVVGADGTWLGRGAFSPESQITVRIWTFDPDEAIDEAFFERRITAALATRARRWNADHHNAMRLIHGEYDGLPGLIADRYADTLVLQCLTTGTERWKPHLVATLGRLLPQCAVYERSDTPARAREGLQPACGVLSGEIPTGLLPVTYAGLQWLVDIRGGHKTGAYLDQADHLGQVGALAREGEVLDGFSYTGGFSLAALRNNAAHVTSLDSSADALERFALQRDLNALDATRSETLCADAFEALRGFRDRGRSFDLIILDPPKFAESRGHLERACRAYKDINLLAFKLLRPGGRLATFSCSGAVGPELFHKVVADAALDARRFARIQHHFSQAPDHPVSLAFPEGQYLKGLLCDTLD